MPLPNAENGESVITVFLGGFNGVGKTSTCEALRRMGFECKKMDRVCYDPDAKPLEFEIFYYSKVLELIGGEIADESPLTAYLYVLGTPFLEGTLSEIDIPPHVKDVADGIMRYVKELKSSGHKFVWLTCDPIENLRRLNLGGECRYRPLLEQRSLFIGYLKELESKYLRDWKESGIVDLVVDTTHKGPEEVAREVVEKLGLDKGRG